MTMASCPPNLCPPSLRNPLLFRPVQLRRGGQPRGAHARVLGLRLLQRGEYPPAGARYRERVSGRCGFLGSDFNTDLRRFGRTFR